MKYFLMIIFMSTLFFSHDISAGQASSHKKKYHVTTLGNNPIPLNAPDVFNESKLLKAAYEGNINRVISLTQTNPLMLEDTDIDGNTALHLAAKGGFAGIVTFLLDHLTVEQIDRKNNREQTALDITKNALVNLKKSRDPLDLQRCACYTTIKALFTVN